LSPDGIRGFLPGFAYQCGVLLSGGVGTIEALMAHRFTYSTAMALTAVVVFSGAAIATAFGREKKGIVFGEGEN
jgi:SHS family lactate transporter-like MFS transporter